MHTRIIDRIPLLRGRLDAHMQEVVNGASVAFVLKVVGAALAFAANVLIARLLGAEGAGVYYIALTVTTIGAAFGRMGLDTTLLRFTAANAELGDWAAVKGAYYRGLVLCMAASTAATLVVFLTAQPFADAVLSKPELGGPIRWMSLGIVPMAVVTLHAESLKGLKRIRDSQLVNGVIVWAIMLAFLVVLARVWGLYGVVCAYIVSACGAAVAGFLLWHAATPRLKGLEGRFESGMLLKSGVPLLWSELMTLGINWSSVLILGVWCSKTDVGVFGAALRMALLVNFILVSVNSIAAPKFAALYAKGDMEALGSTAKNSTKFVTVLAAPMLAVLVFFPAHVMRLFGPQFTAGAAVLGVLAFGQFVDVLTGPVRYLLIISGNEKILRNIVAAVTVVNLALTLTLIPYFGILGAAVATAVSIALQNLLSCYLVHRTVKINTIPWLDFAR